MNQTRQVFFNSFKDPSVADMVLMLFFGYYDRINGQKYSYASKVFPSQQQIAKEIKEASKGKHTPSQSGVSKALKKMDGDTFKFDNQSFKIKKVQAGYKLFPEFIASNADKEELYSLAPFAEESIFSGASTTTIPASIYAFKVKSQYVNQTEDLFRKILADACFEIIKLESLMIIFLNKNNASFARHSNWLKEYFSHQHQWMLNQRKTKEEHKQ